MKINPNPPKYQLITSDYNARTEKNEIQVSDQFIKPHCLIFFKKAEA